MNRAVVDYGVVTAAYWSFMLTDGALRMLVLLHFHRLGYSPVTLAFLFVLYEICGIATNVVGGWLAVRQGLRFTLITGLLLQSTSLVMLSLLDPAWPAIQGVSFVMAAQALSGVAKDLTKMSAKTAVKYLVPAGDGSALFHWVAVLTGSKNAIKGAGFFVGGALLQFCGFRNGLWLLAGGIAATLVAAHLLLPAEIGRPRQKATALGALFAQSAAINRLAAARIFLFGARDIWFVVGVPVYLATVVGFSQSQVGACLAVWVIGYGLVQTIAPRAIRWRLGERPPGGRVAAELAGILAITMAGLAALQAAGLASVPLILAGLALFGILFALNSSLHSYLILDYADGDKAALGVGFYYAANATGRLTGSVLSGLLFQSAGLLGCLAGSAAFLLITAGLSISLPAATGQLPARAEADGD